MQPLTRIGVDTRPGSTAGRIFRYMVVFGSEHMMDRSALLRAEIGLNILSTSDLRLSLMPFKTNSIFGTAPDPLGMQNLGLPVADVLENKAILRLEKGQKASSTSLVKR